MRVILLTLGLLLTTAPLAYGQPVWTPLEGRVLFSLNGLSQPTTQRLTQSLTSSLYGEEARIDTQQSVTSGGMLDFSVGARVWRNVGVSLAFARMTSEGEAWVSGSVPHPLFYDRPRGFASQAGDLGHKQSAVHLQFMWIQPLPWVKDLEVSVSGGPSFFRVRQRFAEGVRFSETGPPYNDIEIDEVMVTSHRAKPLGGNVGVDVTYLVTPNLGGGFFWRYASASTRFRLTTGVEMPFGVGGSQVGGGLRLRF
jgi:hypothetical protein